MKTKYISPYGELEPKPDDFPRLDGIYDDDELVEAYIDFATYFTVIQWNPGGWRREEETNYWRSEHLTLAAARIAAEKRYKDPNIKMPECLIYAVTHYQNQPIGSARLVEGYPKTPSPYDREARIAKRKGKPYVIPKRLRDLPEPGSLPPSERYFEGPPKTLDEIHRAMEAMTVVGKGGSKAAFKYKNRPRGGR